MRRPILRAGVGALLVVRVLGCYGRRARHMVMVAARRRRRCRIHGFAVVLVRHVRGDGRCAGATRRTLDGTERGRATTAKHTYRGLSDMKANPL